MPYRDLSCLFGTLRAFRPFGLCFPGSLRQAHVIKSLLTHPKAHRSTLPDLQELPLSEPDTSEPSVEAVPRHELDENPRYRVLPEFHSNFLPTDRNILVYLPEAYRAEPERRFPVFY